MLKTPAVRRSSTGLSAAVRSVGEPLTVNGKHAMLREDSFQLGASERVSCLQWARLLPDIGITPRLKGRGSTSRAVSGRVGDPAVHGPGICIRSVGA
ncbi:hypothetical protein FKM82_002022 [Ascaphus truei]